MNYRSLDRYTDAGPGGGRQLQQTETIAEGHRDSEFERPLPSILPWVLAHPLWTVVIVAVLARSAAILVTTFTPAGTFALDDTTYVWLAQAQASGDLATWSAFEFQLWNQTLTFLWPLQMLIKSFGQHAWIGQIYVAAWGTAAAALVCAIGLRFLTTPAAIAAGLILALLPSQALWSSLVLKDAPVWATVAFIGLLVAIANRAEGRRLALSAAGIIVGLVALSHLRDHTLIVVAWSLPVAAWFGRRRYRIQRVLGAAVLAAIIPMSVHLGPGGWALIGDPNLSERRLANAQGARSAYIREQNDLMDRLVAVAIERQLERLEATATELDDPNDVKKLQEQVDELREKAADVKGEQAERLLKDLITHVDRIENFGHNAGSPPAPTTVTSSDGSISSDLSHLPRGVVVMLFEPVPWREPTSTNMTLARWEMTVWYPLLVLAAFGLARARRFLWALACPLLVGGGMLIVYALAEGNIGTAYRHRGEIVWTVALLAALGGQGLVQRRRRTAEAPDQNNRVLLDR